MSVELGKAIRRVVWWMLGVSIIAECRLLVEERCWWCAMDVGEIWVWVCWWQWKWILMVV